MFVAESQPLQWSAKESLLILNVCTCPKPWLGYYKKKSTYSSVQSAADEYVCIILLSRGYPWSFTDNTLSETVTHDSRLRPDCRI